jgi:LytS/YehU family sensor histidine kinase
MSEIRLYKGKVPVRIVEKTDGHVLVEVLEDGQGLKKGQAFETGLRNLHHPVKSSCFGCVRR